MMLVLLLAACLNDSSPFAPGGQYNVPPDSLSIDDSGGDTGASVIP